MRVDEDAPGDATRTSWKISQLKFASEKLPRMREALETRRIFGASCRCMWLHGSTEEGNAGHHGP
jgi:hypothetical protein